MNDPQRYRNFFNLRRGMATLELALLFPVLILFSLALIQIINFLQASTITRYGAFVAARAFQVYGDRRLAEISYPHIRSLPYTNENQTMAEAAAEKVIFESLLWEHPRVEVEGDYGSFHRFYNDGVQEEYDGVNYSFHEGAVQINFLGCQGEKGCSKGLGTEIQYCLPIVFPGASALFKTTMSSLSCEGTLLGKKYSGIAVTSKALLGRENTTP